MKRLYRGHEIEVNTASNNTIVFDVFQRGQHLLSGFSKTDFSEQTILTRMMARVDQFIAEGAERFTARSLAA